VTPLRVLSVTPEVFPLVKTGGLADVTGALPLTLTTHDVHTTTLVPGYPAVLAALPQAETVHRFPDLFGGPVRIVRGTVAGLEVMAIDAPHLYARAGDPYRGPDGRDWPDNAIRFAALGAAAAALATGVVPGVAADVLHAHDWQAGLALAYLHLHTGRRPATVMTVHNLAFAGQFDPGLLPVLGLPARLFSIDGIEFHGAISYLKAGLLYADLITTVSPTYAAEIQTPEGGMGFDGLLRSRSDSLVGILNGIDGSVWDPATDRRIPARYSRDDPAGRGVNKAALQARFGLADQPDALLFGVVSRLAWQKGLDLLLASLQTLLDCGAQLVVLGSGDHALEQGFAAAAQRHPGRIGCTIGYDETTAHLIQAGADALLVPSRFEPCGLTQLCALRYGAVPVVARVGGLNDTIVDANEAALAAGVASGIQFSAVTVEGLEGAVRRAASLWRDRDGWRTVQRNGMAADVSWHRPAARYAALYSALCPAHAGQGVAPPDDFS
jgi:starch synthase